MDVHQQDLHDDELYASLGDGSSLQYQTPTEIGAEDFVAIFGIEPATHPLTVHLPQLVIPPGCNHLYECTANTPTSFFSLFSDSHLPVLFSDSHLPVLFSDSHLPVDYASTSDASTSAARAPSIESAVHHALPSSQDVEQGEPGVLSSTKGHPVLAYPNGGYRCMAIVTASGKSSQYTKRSECATTKSFGTSTLVDRTRDPVRSLKHPCHLCDQRLSRRGALTRHIQAKHTGTLFALHRLVNRSLTSLSIARSKGAEAQSVPTETPNHEKGNTSRPMTTHLNCSIFFHVLVLK